jgi:uncharacterized protein YegL
MTLQDALTDAGGGRGEILPAVVCLDCSHSMSEHNKIGSMHDALGKFIQTVRSHQTAKEAIDWEFMSFQTDAAGKPKIEEHIGDFQRAMEPVELPDLVASGGTPLAEVVDLALRKLDAKKAELKLQGQPHFQPWLIVFTDGAPTSQPDVMQEVLDRVGKLVADRKLAVIAVGIGPDANKDFLAKLSPGRAPDMIGEKDIGTYFQKLSDSIIQASAGVVLS